MTATARPVRLVLLGLGMVGHRFLDDLHDRDPDGRFAVTALGAEHEETYNRVLLSDVVAGTYRPDAVRLPAIRSRAVVLRGRRAVAVDRERRVVRDDHGAAHPYDVLVLATGARARVPDLAGVAGPLPSGMHVLRDLADARAILATVPGSRRACVLGGGVLGLEVAAGLVGHGVPTTLVHRGAHLMDRQLSPVAGLAAATALAALGIGVRVGVTPGGVTLADGRLQSLDLADGTRVACDLLVVSAGTTPDVAIAADAGLAVGRGVVVGPDLASPSDPRVFAIGDCAQPAEGATGLVAQGWEQSRRLAEVLTAQPDPEVPDGEAPVPLPTGGTDVVRVKGRVSGRPVDIVTMGAGGASPPHGARTVSLHDASAGRYVEVVTHEGRVVGATCVGSGDVAADLVAAYTRGTPAPSDPAHLLLRPVVGASARVVDSPAHLPDAATVCRCNGVTKGELVAAWRAGAREVVELAAATRATTGCGGCTDAVCGIAEWLGGAPEVHAVPA